jgi:hypothetical protein
MVVSLHRLLGGVAIDYKSHGRTKVNGADSITSACGY